MERLDDKELTLLRQRYVDGLKVEQIGAIHRVHHSTASRWLERIRDALLERTLQHLRAALALSPDECKSAIRMIQSDFDLTLRRFFGGDGG